MDGLYTIKNGERVEVKVVGSFKFNGNIYCIYSLPNKEDTDKEDIYCGKIVEGVLRTIEDEAEKRAVDTIVGDFFDSVKTEDEADDRFIHIKRNDVEVLAEVLDVMEIDGEEYMLLSVEADNDMSDIFAVKVVHLGDHVKYISLTSDEQEMVLDTFNDIING